MRGPKHSSWWLAGLIAAAIAAPFPSASASEVTIPITTEPEVEFPLGVHLVRHRIPPREPAPAALHLGGKIRKEHSTAPQLRELRLEGDRHVELDFTGLPTCRRRDLPDGPHPWDECKDAVVGRGYVEVQTSFPQWYPMDLRTVLDVFNGGTRRGVTKLWIYGYLSTPARGPIVVPLKIREVDEGRFGWEAVASVPVLLEGHGSITDFNLTLQKRFVSATCPGEMLFAASRSTFADGTIIGLKHQQPCR